MKLNRAVFISHQGNHVQQLQSKYKVGKSSNKEWKYEHNIRIKYYQFSAKEMEQINGG